jgi:hypothetical protein
MKRRSNIFVITFVSMLIFCAKCQSLQTTSSAILDFGYSEFAPKSYADEKGLANREGALAKAERFYSESHLQGLKELETRYAETFPERFLELNPSLPTDQSAPYYQ